MSEAFAKANTEEAADRKLAVKTLWASSGRAAEPGHLSYGGLRWNRLHRIGTIESPQSKPSKLKHVAFVAGVDRHSDWLLDFGDHLVFKHGRITCR